MDTDTIAAIATASGKGGIGIIRLSGDKALAIGKQISGINLKPRCAHFSEFFDQQKNLIDNGIAIYFPNPNSFTGEDVVEIQAHGSSVLLNSLLNETIRLGARIARPGEFSERAFLNDKIDLIQAEAIADIIESTSEAAAKSAVRSLSGEFSSLINNLTYDITRLRVYVEAAIDFPEEEVDFLSDQYITDTLETLTNSIENIWQQAKQGSLIRDGLSLVIIGKPNAGKSSLLNLLAGDNLAIVNQQAGTTRDILREDIQIDGLPLRIIDTAGLRNSEDEIEQEGIRRARNEIGKADIVLFMRDASSDSAVCIKANPDNDQQVIQSIKEELKQFDISVPASTSFIVVNNKIDIAQQSPEIKSHPLFTEVFLSAKTGQGLDLFKDSLKTIGGFTNSNESNFVARSRHIDALSKAKESIENGKQQLIDYQAGELLAEDLRLAQNYLGLITGTVTSDDLLGEIFSSFCIGK